MIHASVPPVGDPTFRWTQVAPRLGVQITEVRSLIERLDSDFSPSDWGYRQFGDIADLLTRAVVSDQIRGAADAVATNLFEVRLHEEDFNALIPAGGLPLPDDVASVIDRSRLDMHVTGFFQAFGSVLDCLASVAIGVLRVPRPIQRADFNHLKVLAPTSKEAAAVPVDHRTAWQRVRALLDAKLAGPPTDWLAWSLELRNALMHRPKNFVFNAQRARLTEIVVVTNAFPYWLLRFDPHLVKRPWLPDMAMLPQADSAEDAILAEPTATTMRGLFTALNDLVESVAALLLELWNDGHEGRLALTAPVVAWAPPVNPRMLSFEGFAPGTFSGETMMVSPGDAARVALAASVRQDILGTRP